MAAVRKMLIPLAIRMGVRDPQKSVHEFFQKMQGEVYKFQQKKICRFILYLSAPHRTLCSLPPGVEEQS